LTPYTAPHKPHWKLSEILAQHAGKASWNLTVVDDAHLKAQYISMGPGESTPTKFYADNPGFWVVQDGEIRFTIEGQQPFVASKGFLVQVPYRIPFKMETVGDKPSLRFEVTVAGASVLYPAAAGFKPEPLAGVEYVPVRLDSAREHLSPTIELSQTSFADAAFRGHRIQTKDTSISTMPSSGSSSKARSII
jgi:mannose-6-phosphate isomerase-like protein (cupin superfamily)